MECSNDPKSLNKNSREFFEKDVFYHENIVKRKHGNTGSQSISKRATLEARVSGKKLTTWIITYAEKT